MNFQGLAENLPLITEFIKNNGLFVLIAIGAGKIVKDIFKRKITITIDPSSDK